MYKNKYFCDSWFSDYIDNKYHDELEALSPVARSAHRFSLMCEVLPIHFEKEDYICGHFGYTEIPVCSNKGSFSFPFALPDEIIKKGKF